MYIVLLLGALIRIRTGGMQLNNSAILRTASPPEMNPKELRQMELITDSVSCVFARKSC